MLTSKAVALFSPLPVAELAVASNFTPYETVMYTVSQKLDT